MEISKTSSHHSLEVNHRGFLDFLSERYPIIAWIGLNTCRRRGAESGRGVGRVSARDCGGGRGGTERKTIFIEISIGIVVRERSARTPVQRALLSEAPMNAMSEGNGGHSKRARRSSEQPSECCETRWSARGHLLFDKVVTCLCRSSVNRV